MNDIQIHISDNAIMYLLIVGMECYSVRYWDGKPRTI